MITARRGALHAASDGPCGKSYVSTFSIFDAHPAQDGRMGQGYGETFRAAELHHPRAVTYTARISARVLAQQVSFGQAPGGILRCEGQSKAVGPRIAACNEAREGPNRRHLLQMARAKASAKAVFASKLLLEEQHKS